MKDECIGFKLAQRKALHGLYYIYKSRLRDGNDNGKESEDK